MICNFSFSVVGKFASTRIDKASALKEGMSLLKLVPTFTVATISLRVKEMLISSLLITLFLPMTKVQLAGRIIDYSWLEKPQQVQRSGRH